MILDWGYRAVRRLFGFDWGGGSEAVTTAAPFIWSKQMDVRQRFTDNLDLRQRFPGSLDLRQTMIVTEDMVING